MARDQDRTRTRDSAQEGAGNNETRYGTTPRDESGASSNTTGGTSRSCCEHPY
ncbi:MAG: hypothetical protein Q7T58_03850 [Methylotenera sp.]|nr:hypothetical protein [Methylotenera sp.]